MKNDNNNNNKKPTAGESKRSILIHFVFSWNLAFFSLEMFVNEAMILHTFTCMSNILSNGDSPLGWHMNMDFCSTPCKLGLVSLGNSREDGGLFLWTIRMKNLQAKGLGQQKWYILVIISLGIIIINSTLCFFFCSSQSKPRGRAVAVWWWWTVGLTGGNKSSCSYWCVRPMETEQKKTTVFTE